MAGGSDHREESAYGGGALWESPIIDTKNSLAIFGTGNTEPWNSRGPGKNLWTDSIVALNLYTGQLVWGYQTTHHDMWDSDLPNNGVMFDAPFKVKKTGEGPGDASGSRCHGKYKKVNKDEDRDEDRHEEACRRRRLRQQVRVDVRPRPR